MPRRACPAASAARRAYAAHRSPAARAPARRDSRPPPPAPGPGDAWPWPAPKPAGWWRRGSPWRSRMGLDTTAARRREHAPPWPQAAEAGKPYAAGRNHRSGFTTVSSVQEDAAARATSIRVTAPDGLKLHVRSYGSRLAPYLPVVCLPGLTRTVADFDDLAVAF